jgi:ectoine hydroxylase-related dioxygenase (phytanoyl-CoA dioxygenase family)
MTVRDTVREEDVRTYREHGVVRIRGLISTSWIELLRDSFAENERNPTPRAKVVGEGGGRFFNDYNVWRTHKGFRRFLFESSLAQSAARLLGARRVSLYGDHVLTKHPGTTAQTEWHQDLPYWRVDGEQVGSFWIALDPVTRETGALQFVRGSHLSGVLYNPVGGTPKAFAGHQWVPDINAEPERYDVVCYDLEPGDCTFHHSRMLHAAAGNAHPGRLRRGYAVRVAGDDAVYRNRPTTRDVEEPGLADGAPLVSPGYPVL